MNLINIFNSIRDIPYRISLTWEEEDNCCSGKHKKLLELLLAEGCEVRHRVCIFNWSGLKLPSWLEKIPHEDDCTHSYLEIKIDGEWKILDATWDKKLEKIFKINYWDGKTSTDIGVMAIQIFSPEKSLRIVNNQNEELIINDLKVNGKFYEGFNEWLESIRANL